jgi:hypothetical protein
MPRYFGNETYNGDQGAVKWYNGACAVAEDDTAAIAFLGAIHGITEDTNKHELTVLDKLTREQIDGISSYLGVPLVSTDTKAQVIRKIEGEISTKFIDEITVASAAHESEAGQTTITITGAAGEGNAYYYKTAKDTAPAPLYGDKADSTWTVCTSPFSFEPTATHNKITVVKAVVATGFILARGSDDITTKDS